MESSRISKLKELQNLDQHKTIITVLTLWNTTDDDIETISSETGLSRKEIELILLSHASSKINVLPIPTNEPKFIKIGDKIIFIDKILWIENIAINQVNSVSSSPSYGTSVFQIAPASKTMKSKIWIVNGQQILVEDSADEIMQKIQNITKGEK